MKPPSDELSESDAERLHEAPQPDWITPMLATLTDDGKLRHPRFLGLRRDKDPKDVTRERPQ